jgi:hypothetical protein
MIIVKLIGGLGNQMFQYALGRRLSIERNVPFKLDATAFDTYLLHGYGLSYLNVQAEKATRAEIDRFTLPSSRFRRTFEKLPWTGRYPVVRETSFRYDPRPLDFGKSAYLEGYWQSEKYFDVAVDSIRSDFQVRAPLEGKNLEVSRLAESTESVAIHVRRGDYAANPETLKVHGLCGLDYYRAAIEMLRSKLPEKKLHFFLFSDDPQWVRENLKLEFSSIFVDFNDATRNYEDLRLISNCKHQIIANSSFSWWGAWLNRNPTKVVLAPMKWFSTTANDTRDLIPASWNRI